MDLSGPTGAHTWVLHPMHAPAVTAKPCDAVDTMRHEGRTEVLYWLQSSWRTISQCPKLCSAAVC